MPVCVVCAPPWLSVCGSFYRLPLRGWPGSEEHPARRDPPWLAGAGESGPSGFRVVHTPARGGEPNSAQRGVRGCIASCLCRRLKLSGSLETMYAGRKVPGAGISVEPDIWGQSEICLGAEWCVISFQCPAGDSVPGGLFGV